MRVIPYHPSKNWIPYWQQIRFHYNKSSRLKSRLYITSNKVCSFRPHVNECVSVDHSRYCVSVVTARCSTMGWLKQKYSTLRKSLSLKFSGFGGDTAYSLVVKWFLHRKRVCNMLRATITATGIPRLVFVASCEKFNSRWYILNNLKSEVLSWERTQNNCVLCLLYFEFAS